MSVKGGKLGEIHHDDKHILLLFPIEDKPYIQASYIDKLISYNGMIDAVFDELVNRKREIDKMVHHKDNMKMLWSMRHNTKFAAARFYNAFTRLEQELETFLGERRKIMEEFHEKVMRHYNDQTNHDNKFQPLDAAAPEDLVTSPGIGKAAQQITSETFKRWDYFGLGRSLIPANFDDDGLKDQIARFFIKSHGSFAALGDVVRLLVISPGDMPSDDVGEVAVFNSMSGGDLFFRAVLEKLIHHDADNHFLCTSSSVYLTSRR